MDEVQKSGIIIFLKIKTLPTSLYDTQITVSTILEGRGGVGVKKGVIFLYVLSAPFLMQAETKLSVLLSALVERLRVSRMRNFFKNLFLKKFIKNSKKNSDV